jgi:hypothetical protein
MSIKRTIITTATIVVAVAMVASVVGAQTPTVAQLMADIAALQSQLQGLSGSTSTSTTTGSLPSACIGVTFTRNLTVGSTGSDVKCLQTILNQSASTQVASTGAGSPGNETTYFGSRTLVAVKIWQANAGFSPANQIGPMSRAKLNAQLSGSSSTTTTTTTTTGTTGTTSTGSVSATLASDNPPAGAVVGGQAQADLMHINFTGNGTVTSLTLQRTGISDTNLFTAIYLYDGNTRITGGYSFNSNSTLTMNGLNIAVNGSHEISVRGDVWSGGTYGVTATESTAAVTLTGFVANGTTTSANVMGNTMAVASGSLATVSFTSDPTAANPSNNTALLAGSTNQTLWSRTLSVTPRAVMLYGLTVKQIGSAPSNTLANVGLYIDSALVKTATINSNNQFVFDASSSPATLSTGSHLVEVRGDVVAGSSRQFYLSLEQGSDISVKDSQLGVYVTTTYNSNTVSNVNGGTMTINGTTGGSITVTQDQTFNNTTTLVGGASNVTMGSWVFTSYGEDEKVTELKYTPTIAGTPEYLNSSLVPQSITNPSLQNVGLYVNGAQVGSNQTATTGVPVTFSNLGSNLIIPAGTSVTVSIKGDVITGAGTTTYPTSPVSTNYYQGTVVFNPTADSNDAQGQSSSQLITVPSATGGQTLTVSSSNVSFAGTTGFANVAAAPNNAGVEIGSYTVQTGSAEGVTLNNIAVTLGGSMVTANDLTNLKVKVNGTFVGTSIGQPVSGANNFSVTVPVAVSSSAEIDVYGDFGSLTSCGGGNCTVTPSMTISYRGNTSNTVNTASYSPAVTTTAGTSTINPSGVTLDNSAATLAAQLVSGNGTSAVPMATFKVVAANAQGGAVIQNMTFSTVSNTIASVTVNGQTANITGGTGTIYNVGIKVPSTYSGVDIPVTVKLVCIGTGCSGASDAAVQLTLASMTYNNGATIATVTPSPAAVSNTLNLVASVPTVSLTSGSMGSLSAGTTQQIGQFTIAAGSGGDIQLKQIPVVTAVNGTVTLGASSVQLCDSTGNCSFTGAPTAVASGSANFTFTNPVTIGAGNSVTYTVYATTGGSNGSAGTSNVTFQLGSKGSTATSTTTGFLWTDVAGNSYTTLGNTYITGNGIYNWPTGSQSRSN